MEETPRCAECGGALSAQSRLGVCYRCLLRSAQDTILESDSSTRSSAEDAAEFLSAGIEVAGRYTDQREHARGGMGRILIAFDEQLGREVAIKELLRGGPEAAGSPSTRPLQDSSAISVRFIREARITGRLEHPAIVPVHELGVRANGDLYYVMKHVKGVSLAARLLASETLQERLKLLPHVLDVCQAIAYAHSRGVIHRDIKPANIMVGEFGETVVLDWGLARFKDGEEAEDGELLLEDPIPPSRAYSGDTAFGQVLGTPAYMAPEQAQGRIDLVDERSDIFGLGALLYTTLTGRAPFQGEDRRHIIEQVLHESPEAIRGIEPAAPAELVAICEKAMAREPMQRYQSAMALADELKLFLNGGLVSAYTYGFPEPMRRLVRRNTKAVATAAVAFILLNAVVIYSYLHILGERNRAVAAQRDALKARDEATQARDEAAEARIESEQEAYYRGIAYAHARIQQGEYGDVPKLLEELPERFRGWEWGYLMGQCHLEERAVQAHEGPITAFAASEDGSIVTTAGEDGNLILWDATKLSEQWRYPQKLDIVVKALALDPSGKTLAAGGSGLLLLKPETGHVIVNSFPRPCDAGRATEFAMAMTVTGAPDAGGTGRVRFNLISGDQGWAEFTFHNGTQSIRLNLERESIPDGSKYRGLVRFYRLELPFTLETPEAFRNMEVEIDWIAVTDDPRFVPDQTLDLPAQAPGDPSVPLGQVSWTFDEVRRDWKARGSGAVFSQRPDSLVMTYDLTQRFNPGLALFPDSSPPPQTDAIVFSPDASRLYMLADNEIHVLRASDGHEVKTITGLTANALAVSPDGTLLVAGGTSIGGKRANHYWVFDTVDFEPRLTFGETGDDTSRFVRVAGMVFDPESKHLLCVGEGWLGLRDLASGALTREWRSNVDWHEGVGAPKAFWRDPTHFYVGDRDGTITLYDTQGGRTEAVVQTGASIVSLADQSSSGRITLADRDGQLKSWLPETFSQVKGAVGLESADFSWGQVPKLSADGRFMTVLSWSAGWTLWDMNTLDRLSSPFDRSDAVTAFRPKTDEVVLFPTAGRHIKVCSLKDGTERVRISLNQPITNSFNYDFSMDSAGKYLALSRYQGMPMVPMLIDLSNGQPVPCAWPAADGKVCISGDGNRLAISDSIKARIDIRTVPEGQIVSELQDDGADLLESGLSEMRFHPAGDILAASTYDGYVLTWDLQTATLKRLIRAQETGDQLSLCFSPDGNRLATGGDDGYVRVWDWRTGRQLLAFRENFLARGVAFSSDGSILVSGGGDPPVRVRVAWPRSATLLPEIQQRRSCHAHLIALDSARLAWAVAKSRPPEDDSVTISELQPYLTESASPLTCLSGGDYRLGSVKELPSCSIHGAPWENPSLQEQVEAQERDESPLATIFLARLFASKDASELSNLAHQWKEQNRHLPLAIRLLQRATELEPESKSYWRLLGHAELLSGQLEQALTDFRKGFEPESDGAAVGLALALITRGTEQDLVEACAVLEAQSDAASNTVYTEDAMKALDNLPETANPQLRERIRTLLKARLTP